MKSLSGLFFGLALGFFMGVLVVKNAKISQCIQTDVRHEYSTLSEIKLGMSEQEVTKALGEADKKFSTEEYSVFKYYTQTGYFPPHFDGGKVILPFFRYYFEEEILSHITDSFGIDISDTHTHPLPSGLDALEKIKIQPVLPANHAEFRHFPRYIDFRWMPFITQSAVGDIIYECEVDIRHPSQWTRVINKKTRNINFSFLWAGTNQGRWRVRATVGKRESPWSDYSYFNWEGVPTGKGSGKGSVPESRNF